MSQPPTVSVILPVYNVERFVVQAICSVLDQTFTDLELIVVDGGGSDNSVALCQVLADNRTRVVSNPGRGIANARNAGIAAARGTFVAMLDSDDAWALNKLEQHVAFLRANPSVGVSYDGTTPIDEDGFPRGLPDCPRPGLYSARAIFRGRALRNGSSPVYRKAALEDAAIRPGNIDRVWYFDERLPRAELLECWARIALTTHWKFASLPIIATVRRIRDGRLSGDIIRHYEAWMRVCDSIRVYAPDFVARHGAEARACLLRCLADRCLEIGDRTMALHLACQAVRAWPALMLTEPVRTLATIVICGLSRAISVAPRRIFSSLCEVPSIKGLAL